MPAPLLPDPPPPRPDAREASIAAAMRRFDGADAAAPRAGMRPGGGGWWSAGRHRAQWGALATAALVATIALPMWLSGEVTPPVVPPRVTAPQEARVPAYAPTPGAAPTAQSTGAAIAEPIGTPSPPATPLADLAAPDAEQSAAMTYEAAPPAPPPPPPPPPPPATYAPAPVALAGRAAEPETDGNTVGDIMVTGSRVQQSPSRKRDAAREDLAKISRGDWNACTVNDPVRNVANCRRSRERVSAAVLDGLAQAWRGDDDAAIEAFDRAIAAEPTSASAYLNRGLAHARNGDSDRAIDDLDRAVRYAPRDARGYYNRSVILRRSGEIRRAEADERRALRLNPSYEPLIP